MSQNWGSGFWSGYWGKIKNMAANFNYGYVVEFIAYFVIFYVVLKILKENKGGKLIAVFIATLVMFGFAISLSPIPGYVFMIIVGLVAVLPFTMFNTEVKRSLLGTGAKKHVKREHDSTTVRDIEFIIDEIIHAVQHMSKNDIGALIVLSNKNLPEGIVSSGTVINANINAQMIEAVFYPKAPLHDGAMIIEGDRIHAAGCFLPLIQNDNIPQEVGSRHRAALGVTTVAAVTSIVVSEETGVISIVRNGEIKKKYASDSDLKNVLSNYYWSDLTGKEKSA